MAGTVLGLNLTGTAEGIALDDGAAVLLEDGVVTVAIAQERITRRKHAGGVGAAVRYCLDARQLSLDDIDMIAVSTCCDEAPDPAFVLNALNSEGIGARKEQLRILPSHHLSHAVSAFYPSGFDEALVIVADNEGSIIGPRVHPRYWHNRLERTSVYLGRGDDLRLIRRYGDRPGELSLGAAYNHFTTWLGFGSYHDAGKVMALAAYGQGRFHDVEVFKVGDLTCRLSTPQLSPIAEADDVPTTSDEFDREAAKFLRGESVRDLVLGQRGIDIGPARTDCSVPDDTQKELAWLVQSGIERALVSMVRTAVAETGVRRVCLAGGVALNCVANTLIALMPEVEELFVQPAASDVGQALGNVLWAHQSQARGPRRWRMRSCSLGREYSLAEIEEAIEPWGDRLAVERPVDVAARAAELIADGAIIGWFQNGSEYGLRGLGRRSVLGDPRSTETKLRLDSTIKRREAFRPYAPSVLEEEVAAWFDCPEDFLRTARQPMRFMFVAPTVLPERRARIPAVTFIDGTARLQAVERSENPRYHALIRHFQRLTGVPLVLNTSFNAAGDPVVETPGDALHSLVKMGLDAVVLGDLIVTETARPNGHPGRAVARPGQRS